ncbi:hypothetical protein AVEN_29346-1 [Araneus ventricosus]|uniref:Uncharacterized protein n=1 Tax=Araneus ventricosus TaxID=182803 RepID=A0A4Y2IXB1_ARAVE|nr:hypothetical protein AVEN_29346-1 [Araneus ventricosus]
MTKSPPVHHALPLTCPAGWSDSSPPTLPIDLATMDSGPKGVFGRRNFNIPLSCRCQDDPVPDLFYPTGCECPSNLEMTCKRYLK